MSRKLPARAYQTVFSALMALFMSFLMSGAITAINIGLPPDFIAIWMHAWGYAFSIALPVIMVVAPVVRALTGRLVETPGQKQVAQPAPCPDAG